MMIPHDIRALCEARPGSVYIDDATAKKRCMAALGVPQSSEFHQFFTTFVIENMASKHSGENLEPIADPGGELNPAIGFAWEVWGIPHRFIAMTSLEGEGGYFYDRDTGRVVDFELGRRDRFIAGDVRILGESVFDFIRWFLGDDAEPRGYAASAP
jgi:hypothetical protein